MITPATDSATEPVTTLDARQDGEQIGSASGQSGLSSAGKVTQKIDNHQEKEQKFSGEGENSSVVPGINRPEGEVLKLMGYDV